MTLYKVTGATGASINSGALQWSPPHDGEPGDWHEDDGQIVLCERGLHLTDDPERWYQAGSRVWECGASEAVASDECERKSVCARARLVREVVGADLLALRIATYGEHEIREGRWTASGSATVRAYGSATVRAYGSATVEAYHVSTVIAHWGGATVMLHERAVFVDHRGSSTTTRAAEVLP